MKNKALVYLWTGNGAGKTTSALGTALRAVGHNLKVIIIQFMKGRKNIGEYKIAKKLYPNYKIYQFGSPEFIDLKNPSEEDKQRAKEGLDFAKKCIKKKPFLLILDEINLACAVGLLNSKDLIKFLDTAPPETTVYLTGRNAPKELIKRADFVNEVIEIKKPRKMPPAKKGIEY